MTLPSFLLALVIALLYGALYHLLRDGGVGHLFMFLGLSALGFGIGQLAGDWFGWDFILLGQINLGLASIGSLLVLIIGDWLSRIEAKPESKV
jgi:hypothetical protein